MVNVEPLKHWAWDENTPLTEHFSLHSHLKAIDKENPSTGMFSGVQRKLPPVSTEQKATWTWAEQARLYAAVTENTVTTTITVSYKTNDWKICSTTISSRKLAHLKAAIYFGGVLTIKRRCKHIHPRTSLLSFSQLHSSTYVPNTVVYTMCTSPCSLQLKMQVGGENREANQA